MKNKSSELILNAMVEAAFKEYMGEKYDDDPIEAKMELINETEKAYIQRQQKIYKSVLKEVKSADSRRCEKIAVLTAASLITLLILAGTVSAIRTFFTKTYSEISENFVHLITDSGYDKDEEYNIVQFEKREDIIVPSWLPKGFKPIVTTDEKTNLLLEYMYDDKYINISETVIGSDYKNTFGIFFEDNGYSKFEKTILDMQATIIEYKGENKENAYIASFNSNDISYLIRANLTETEFYKFLNSLKFYRKGP